MASYCALLRGIMPSNPQMRNEKLRAVFTNLGFSSVGSVLASGNIVFAADSSPHPSELESQIQRALQNDLSIPGGTTVRTQEQLSSLVDAVPFGELEHSKETYLAVTFLKGSEPLTWESLPRPENPAFVLHGYHRESHALLSVCDTASAKTPDHMRWLERNFGKDITTRTWNTVVKILAKMPE